MTDEQISELIPQGIEALVGGIGFTIDALFEKSPIISKEQNPFGELPKHVQTTIVRNALQMVLAQSLAAVSIITAGRVGDKEILSANAMLIKRYFDDYLKNMKGQLEKPVDKGSEAGNEGSGLILGPGDN